MCEGYRLSNFISTAIKITENIPEFNAYFRRWAGTLSIYRNYNHYLRHN